MSSVDHSTARLRSRRAERSVLEFVDEIESVPDSEIRSVDARLTSLLEPSERVPLVSLALVERGTLCEIKTALVAYGSDSRRGRFHFRKEQHSRLLEEGAVYLLGVVEPTPSREVISLKAIAASSVDGILSSFSWIETDERPPYIKLSWNRFFRESEVSKGGPSQ